MKGVELALEGGDGPLLALPSDGARVAVLAASEVVSVSACSLAFRAFSKDAGVCKLIDLRLRVLWTRLLVPFTCCARLDGQAHSEAEKGRQNRVLQRNHTEHTFRDGVLDDHTFTATRATWMGTAAEGSSRLTDLDQHTISMVAF
jgi:hypothetical protein